MLLFGGTANPQLARALAAELGLPLAARTIERFPDGEVAVEIEEDVRGRTVCLLQPTSPPTDLHLFELLAFADAARRAGALGVSAIVPYFGYARADRRHGVSEPITARLVADLLETAGVGRLLTLDLHTDQIEGFFRIPVQVLSAVGTLCDALAGTLPENAVIVSPDAGRVAMASRYAERLGLPLAILHKRRESGESTRIVQLVGEVSGRHCLLIDDMISTGGTLARSIDALRAAGARGFTVAATHGLLVGEAWEKLLERNVDRVCVTDSVSVERAGRERLVVVPVAPLLAVAVARL